MYITLITIIEGAILKKKTYKHTATAQTQIRFYYHACGDYADNQKVSAYLMVPLDATRALTII